MSGVPSLDILSGDFCVVEEVGRRNSSETHEIVSAGAYLRYASGLTHTRTVGNNDWRRRMFAVRYKYMSMLMTPPAANVSDLRSLCVSHSCSYIHSALRVHTMADVLAHQRPKRPSICSNMLSRPEPDDVAERLTAQRTMLCTKLPAHVPLRSKLVLELRARARDFLRYAADTVGAISNVVGMRR